MRRAYIVNTNLSYDEYYAKEKGKTIEYSYKPMLENERASAFGDERRKLARIQSGDLVFLYHNKVGICAVGYAKSSARPGGTDYRKRKAAHIPLEDFLGVDPLVEVDLCIPHDEMTPILARSGGKKVGVRGTCIELNAKEGEGEKLEQAFRSRVRKARKLR